MAADRTSRLAPRPYMLGAYFVGIVTAEALIAAGAPVYGIVCDSIVLFACVNAYSLGFGGGQRSAPGASDVHLLGLVPLLRILSVAMPVNEARELLWYALVGAPLLVGIVLAARSASINPIRLAPSRRQAALALTGVPLGLVAFAILHPDPLVARSAWLTLLAAAAILVIFTGFAEELLFRGLVQGTFGESFGQSTAIVLTSVLFAAVYVTSRSPVYVLFMGVVGLVFGWTAAATRSLLGVSFAHGLLNVGLLVVWPLVF